MRKYFLLFAVIFLFVFLAPVYADKLIVPGVRAGDYCLDMPASGLISKLGHPAQKDPVDDYEIWWYGPTMGFAVKNQKVTAIMLVQPAAGWITEEGVTIGSAFEKVKQVYGKDYTYELNTNKETLNLYDSSANYPFDGIMFCFKNNIVIKIILTLPVLDY